MNTVRTTFFVIAALLSGFSTSASGKIFYSKNEAMVLAFGEGAQVETLSLFPDEQQTAAIEKDAKVKLDSGMFSFYVGKQAGKIVGYAAIETMTVRTKPETLMIVLSLKETSVAWLRWLSTNRPNTSRRKPGMRNLTANRWLQSTSTKVFRAFPEPR